jgi:hypothetical protein
MTTPEWLAQRDGQLRPGVNADTYLVRLSGAPQYRLAVVPAGGQFTCAVTQTNNGKRLDSGSTHPTAEAALQCGLDELGKTLGWL